MFYTVFVSFAKKKDVFKLCTYLQQENDRRGSQKYNSKRKYNSNEKHKIPAGACSKSEGRAVKRKKQAIVCNGHEEQALHDIPSDPNEGLRLENEIHVEPTDDA